MYCYTTEDFAEHAAGVLLASTFGDAMACVVRESTAAAAGAGGTSTDPAAVPPEVAALAAKFRALCR